MECKKEKIVAESKYDKVAIKLTKVLYEFGKDKGLDFTELAFVCGIAYAKMFYKQKGDKR